MLLHLHLDLLSFLPIFVHYFGETAIIGLLLLLLLLLGAEGNADVAVVVDRLLQVARLGLHRSDLFIDTGSERIIVALSANLVFL